MSGSRFGENLDRGWLEFFGLADGVRQLLCDEGRAGCHYFFSIICAIVNAVAVGTQCGRGRRWKINSGSNGNRFFGGCLPPADQALALVILIKRDFGCHDRTLLGDFVLSPNLCISLFHQPPFFDPTPPEILW
jgi:hypothetical protein